MKRDPIEQFMKNPDNAAKLFLLFQGVQIATTALLVIVALYFILHLCGIV